MAYKSGAMGRSHDIGLNHGPGKGSAPRSNHSREFFDNFDEIVRPDPKDFEADSRVTRKGNKVIKRYG